MRKNVGIIIILIVILVLSSCSSKEAPNTTDNVVKDSPKENENLFILPEGYQEMKIGM